MNSKLMAGVVASLALVAGLNAPAQARYNPYQDYLNRQAVSNYYDNTYGYNYGEYGLNPNDPNYFRQAQIRQWQESQGGGYAQPRYIGHRHSQYWR